LRAGAAGSSDGALSIVGFLPRRPEYRNRHVVGDALERYFDRHADADRVVLDLHEVRHHPLCVGLGGRQIEAHRRGFRRLGGFGGIAHGGDLFPDLSRIQDTVRIEDLLHLLHERERIAVLESGVLPIAETEAVLA
jgi:hypothetical protein